MERRQTWAYPIGGRKSTELGYKAAETSIEGGPVLQASRQFEVKLPDDTTGGAMTRPNRMRAATAT